MDEAEQGAPVHLSLIHISPCESYKLYTDGHRLSQILINLMTNAGKFTSQGSITIGFEVREKENRVQFFVADTGSGIEMCIRDRFWRSIFRVRRSKRMIGRGSPEASSVRIAEGMLGTTRRCPPASCTKWAAWVCDPAPACM